MKKLYGFSVIVGECSSLFGSKAMEDVDHDDDREDTGDAIFNSSWLPGGNSKYIHFPLFCQIICCFCFLFFFSLSRNRGLCVQGFIYDFNLMIPV